MAADFLEGERYAKVSLGQADELLYDMFFPA